MKLPRRGPNSLRVDVEEEVGRVLRSAWARGGAACTVCVH